MRYGKLPSKRSFSVIHEKTWILDDVIVMTGSHNLTHHSARHNRENLVVIAEAQSVTRERARFRELWTNESKPASISDEDLAGCDLGVDSTGLSCHFGPRAQRAVTRAKSRSVSRSVSVARSSSSGVPAEDADAAGAGCEPVSKAKPKTSKRRGAAGGVPPPAPPTSTSLEVWESVDPRH